MTKLIEAFRANYRGNELAATQLSGSDNQEYLEILNSVYGRHGYVGDEHVAPSSYTRLGVRIRSDEEGEARLAGICAVGEPRDAERDAVRQILERQRDLEGRNLHESTLVELRNVAIRPPFLGSPVLAILCCAASIYYISRTPKLVVYGIVRYSVLKSFLAFGLLPAEMEPIHVNGDTNVDDYVIYYDLRSKSNINYLFERFSHYCLQAKKMNTIRQLRRNSVVESEQHA